MNSVLQDLRYAIRQILKSPGFTFTTLLSLTLGIGATTAIFSVVYGILLDPYPYRDADCMVHVSCATRPTGGWRFAVRQRPRISGTPAGLFHR